MDQNDEIIIIKGITSYGQKLAVSDLYFTLKVYFKDGKYQYEATDFKDQDRQAMETGLLNPKVMYKADGTIHSFYKNMYLSIIKGMESVSESFKKGMAAKAKNDF